MFFFNDTATTEIYTLSLHDALPILNALHAPEAASRENRGGLLHAGCRNRRLRGRIGERGRHQPGRKNRNCDPRKHLTSQDRKSTRLNSSHLVISYAVFCLKQQE